MLHVIFWDYFLLVICSAAVSRHVDTGSAQLLCCVLCGGEMDPFHVTCAMQCMCVCVSVLVVVKGGTCRKRGSSWWGGEIVAAVREFFGHNSSRQTASAV